MMIVLIGLGRYLRRILIAISILTNVVLGGSLNQTLSARNWEWKRKGKPNLVWLRVVVLVWNESKPILFRVLS